MNLDEFAQAVKENILSVFSENSAIITAETGDAVKNNDTRLKYIAIREEGEAAAPLIYLNEYYEKYARGISTPEQAADEIAGIYTDNRNPNIQAEILSTWDLARDRVVARLRAAEGNEQFLSDKPHTKTGDMAVTYHILLDSGKAGTEMSAAVTDELLAGYGISKKELHETALANNRRLLPPEIRKLSEIVKDMAEAAGMKEELFPETGAPDLYVLTNKAGMHGAAGILDPETMEQAAKQAGGEFYVLPSSVHEVLLISKKCGISYKELEEMVNEVNRTQVQPDEVLSAHVYEADLEYHVLVRSDEEEAHKKEEEALANHADKRFRYKMLSRMQSDCDYYLGYGRRNAKDLWAGNERRHIRCMKALYNSFPEGEKPEWLTMEQIEDYKRKMVLQKNEECPAALKKEERPAAQKTQILRAPKL